MTEETKKLMDDAFTKRIQWEKEREEYKTNTVKHLGSMSAIKDELLRKKKGLKRAEWQKDMFPDDIENLKANIQALEEIIADAEPAAKPETDPFDLSAPYVDNSPIDLSLLPPEQTLEDPLLDPITIGSTIFYAGKKQEVLELPNEENGRKYTLQVPGTSDFTAMNRELLAEEIKNRSARLIPISSTSPIFRKTQIVPPSLPKLTTIPETKVKKEEDLISVEPESIPTPAIIIPEPEATPTLKIEVAEEIIDFVEKLNLEPLLAKEFGGLDNLQQLKVIRDLQRRIVDIVKSDAQTQYSEDLKARSWIKKIASAITKEKDLRNLEKSAFDKLRNSPEGKEIIKQDLELLTRKTQKQNVGFSGQVYYLTIDGSILGSTREDKKALSNLDAKANKFANMPYEWGQEKGGKHKKQYDKAREEYDETRNEVLRIKTSSEKAENKGRAVTEIMEMDNIIQMEQLLNTHPEFEKALNDFERSPDGKEAAKTLGNFWEGIKGKNFERLGLGVAGAGARTLARGAAMFTGLTGITFIAAPVIGATVGYWRGKFRAKDTLEERQKEARHGKKDESAEATNTESAQNLNDRITTMLEALSNASTPEERERRLDQIKRRIEYTENKIESGLVNFGDNKIALKNQYNLINNLNRALVISAVLEETTRKDIDERLARFLSYKDEKISKAQEEFIKKQAWNSAAYGAGFATAGYVVRWAGEHFGWWGHHEAPGIKHPSTAPENISHLKTTVPEATHPLVTPPSTQTTTPALEATTNIPTPANMSAETFKSESITFEHGKGGIQGILDLKTQMREHYHNDFSKAPASVQEFMKETNVIKQAIKLGLYDPNNPSGNESALIEKGSVLKFDEHGNLLFGKPDASGNIPVLEKYHGKMFDSDHSTDHVQEKTIPEQWSKSEIVTTEPETTSITDAHTPTAEELREKIIASHDSHDEKYDPDASWRQPVKQTSTDNIDIIKQRYSGLLRSDFASNPFHLSGNKLMEAYNIHHSNISHIFKHHDLGLEAWDNMKKLNASKLLGIKDYDLDNRLLVYMHELQKVTGLKPKIGLFGLKPETTEHYIARTLQKATEMGRLEKLELK